MQEQVSEYVLTHLNSDNSMKRLIYAALAAIIGTACGAEGEERNCADNVGDSIVEASMMELGNAAAVIKDVIDYNAYLVIENSDADEATKGKAWNALGYTSRSTSGNIHFLTTEATNSNNKTITTVTTDNVALDEGGKWTVERTGYKPYTMEISGEAGGYVVKFKSITVGDRYGKEHNATAHFNVTYDSYEDRLYFDGKLSSIHCDKSELYPLRLTTDITSPMCVTISNRYFVAGATRVACSDQYYKTADNVKLTIHANRYDRNGRPIVEIEYNGRSKEVGRIYQLMR